MFVPSFPNIPKYHLWTYFLYEWYYRVYTDTLQTPHCCFVESILTLPFFFDLLYMIFVFCMLIFKSVSSRLSFYISSLLTRPSNCSSMITKSPAYTNSRGQASLKNPRKHFHDNHKQYGTENKSLTDTSYHLKFFTKTVDSNVGSCINIVLILCLY